MRKQMLVVLAVGLVLSLLSGCLGVGGSPAALVVKPDALDFRAAAEELTVFVSNSGKKELNWKISIEGAEEWLTVFPLEGINDALITVSITREGLEPGEYTALLKISSNGGEKAVPVVMVVEGPKARPGQVYNLDVRGFTLPEAVFQSSSLGYSPLKLRSLIELADNLLVASPEPGAETYQSAKPGQLPAGYEGVFVLSWDPVPEATGYRLLKEQGRGYVAIAELAVADLENPAEPTYVAKGAYQVGDKGTFKVQAINSLGAGEASVAEWGVIIGVQELITPAGGSTASGEPKFVWKKHPEASGYLLTLALGDGKQHIWQQAVSDGKRTELQYPGDSFIDPLSAGSYVWFVLAQGAIEGGRANAYSLSQSWMFEVK